MNVRKAFIFHVCILMIAHQLLDQAQLLVSVVPGSHKAYSSGNKLWKTSPQQTGWLVEFHALAWGDCINKLYILLHKAFLEIIVGQTGEKFTKVLILTQTNILGA